VGGSGRRNNGAIYSKRCPLYTLARCGLEWRACATRRRHDVTRVGMTFTDKSCYFRLVSITFSINDLSVADEVPLKFDDRLSQPQLLIVRCNSFSAGLDGCLAATAPAVNGDRETTYLAINWLALQLLDIYILYSLPSLQDHDHSIPATQKN
jgi:hypothetical protein